MPTEELNYFYDAQIRRWMMQAVRVFSNISYATGVISNGQPVLKKIPANYALTDRMVANILKNNSENAMLTIPMITVYLANVEHDRERIKNPTHVDHLQIYERQFDLTTQTYGSELGASYTMERYMPVPYNLEIQVDVITSNQEQKNQIFEQISVLFNPGIEIQSSDNVFDWTAITEMFLESITWSSRGIPVGTSDEFDVMTFMFKLPVWFSPPALLLKQRIINTIVTDIISLDDYVAENIGKGYDIEWSDNDLLGRIVTTPGNHTIDVNGNVLTLLGPALSELNEDGEPYRWDDLLEQYGELRPDISIVSLNPTLDIEYKKPIQGTVSLTNEPNKLLWTPVIATLPPNNLEPIKAMINPHTVWPGHGLQVPVPGVRYLLLNDIGDNVAWGDISADINDIIEYDGTNWNTVFIAAHEKDNLYFLLNSHSNKQLKWNGREWTFAIDGTYNAGFWRVLI